MKPFSNHFLKTSVAQSSSNIILILIFQAATTNPTVLIILMSSIHTIQIQEHRQYHPLARVQAQVPLVASTRQWLWVDHLVVAVEEDQWVEPKNRSWKNKLSVSMHNWCLIHLPRLQIRGHLLAMILYSMSILVLNIGGITKQIMPR